MIDAVMESERHAAKIVDSTLSFICTDLERSRTHGTNSYH